MRKPEFVTFTGADDQTDIARMLSIQERYGRVEWGVLFSPKLQGKGRYPTFAFIDELVGKGLRLAAHVCGGYAVEILSTGRSEVLSLYPRSTFGRIQVNTQEPVDTAALARFASATGASRAVLQAKGDFPDDDSVDWLHDASRGRGVLPPSWPSARPPHALVGYAGGLGPETVAEELPSIALAAGGVPYVIDMETRLRSEDRFDLDACLAVLDLVYGAA